LEDVVDYGSIEYACSVRHSWSSQLHVPAVHSLPLFGCSFAMFLIICRTVLFRPANYDPCHCKLEYVLTVELQNMSMLLTCLLNETVVNIDWTHDK
jgi:hypothetical protein